jgi:SAM-dependent methyltransferase
MRQIAQNKNPEIVIKDGNHEDIPFNDCFFDFILFMTDVIHHIPDLDLLFSSFHRKLKESALVCILTSSHKQIEARWYNEYFPSLSENKKRRYPDIEEIITKAKNNGLSNKNKCSIILFHFYACNQYFQFTCKSIIN